MEAAEQAGEEILKLLDLLEVVSIKRPSVDGVGLALSHSNIMHHFGVPLVGHAFIHIVVVRVVATAAQDNRRGATVQGFTAVDYHYHSADTLGLLKLDFLRITSKYSWMNMFTTSNATSR